MIDYHADQVGLSEFTAALSAAVFPDPGLSAAQQEAREHLDTEKGPALLGAFVHQLLAHAVSDGWELELLQRAVELWGRATSLCGQLGSIRADLEAALESPGDAGSAERFNDASVRAQDFANTAVALRGDIDSLRADVLSLRHLPAHPRQDDRGTDAWDWSDLTLGRRTDALVRSLFSRVEDAAGHAFALGVTASYGANVTGSSYLGHVVGGPRRLHRYRDRLARNAVGS